MCSGRYKIILKHFEGARVTIVPWLGTTGPGHIIKYECATECITD